MKTSSLTLPQAIDLAMQYQTAGRLDEARALYGKVLGIDSGNIDALHLLGTLEYQAGDPAAALGWFAKALAVKAHPQMLNNQGLAQEALGDYAAAAASYRAACELKPDYAAAWDHLGDVLTLMEQGDAAIAAYRQALALDPQLATAWSSLGNALRLAGDLDAAAAALERALALDTDSPEANLNLGGVHYAAGRLAEARACFEKAVALAPEFALAHYNLGSLDYREGRLAPAAAAFGRALELDPDNADAWNNLGLALLEQGRRAEGAECLRRVVALRPDDAAMLANLGIALQELGAGDEALGCFERALVLDPDEGTARHFVNVARGIASDRAPADYVRSLFDAYADKFDRQLVGELEYRAPDFIAAALTAALPPQGQGLEVLDLGCGTGLLGPMLRPLSRRLIGLDLSAGMLQKAQALGVYDELLATDLLDYLAGATPLRFDVITAADVFVYLGDLAPVFAAVSRVLRGGGLFAFTVERDDTSSQPYRLAGSGRYRHARGYVESLAAALGLRCLQADPVVLRKERLQPIEGMVYLFAAPD